jgi:hypothetical protein
VLRSAPPQMQLQEFGATGKMPKELRIDIGTDYISLGSLTGHLNFQRRKYKSFNGSGNDWSPIL